MKHIPLHELHAALFETMNPLGTDAEREGPTQKKYERMRRIKLARTDIDTSLSTCLTKRKSDRTPQQRTIMAATLGAILSSVATTSENRRPYPSGGKKYPIEMYFVSCETGDVPPGVYHYRPDEHSLEFLWETPPHTTANTYIESSWLKKTPPGDVSGYFIFTALWHRGYPRYQEFSYPLALIECGHMAQNILLAGAACGINGVPVAGLHTEAIAELLDCPTTSETPLYCVLFLSGETRRAADPVEK